MKAKLTREQILYLKAKNIEFENYLKSFRKLFEILDNEYDSTFKTSFYRGGHYRPYLKYSTLISNENYNPFNLSMREFLRESNVDQEIWLADDELGMFGFKIPAQFNEEEFRDYLKNYQEFLDSKKADEDKLKLKSGWSIFK